MNIKKEQLYISFCGIPLFLNQGSFPFLTPVFIWYRVQVRFHYSDSSTFKCILFVITTEDTVKQYHGFTGQNSDVVVDFNSLLFVIVTVTLHTRVA